MNAKQVFYAIGFNVQIVLIILKLTGTVDWAWGFVLLPIVIYPLAILFTLFAAFVMAFLYAFVRAFTKRVTKQ